MCSNLRTLISWGTSVTGRNPYSVTYVHALPHGEVVGMVLEWMVKQQFNFFAQLECEMSSLTSCHFVKLDPPTYHTAEKPQITNMGQISRDPPFMSISRAFQYLLRDIVDETQSIEAYQWLGEEKFWQVCQRVFRGNLGRFFIFAGVIAAAAVVHR